MGQELSLVDPIAMYTAQYWDLNNSQKFCSREAVNQAEVCYPLIVQNMVA
jgi:hypothetical protein